MTANFSYQDYLDALRHTRYEAPDDSGHYTDNAMSEAEWNNTPQSERMGLMGGVGGAGGVDFAGLTGGGYTADEDSDVARRWFAANGNPAWMRQNGGNGFYVVREQPNEAVLRHGAWQDPTTGMWVIPHEAIRPEILQAAQERIDQSGLFRGPPLQQILTGVAIVLGAAGAAGAFGAEAGLGGAEAGLGGASLEDIPASVVQSGSAGGGLGAGTPLPENYWDIMASNMGPTDVPIGEIPPTDYVPPDVTGPPSPYDTPLPPAGGGGGAGGGGFELPPYEPPPLDPSLAQLPPVDVSGGGNLPFGLTNRDVIGAGMSLGGSLLNRNAARRTAEEQRNFTREQFEATQVANHPNVTNPHQTSTWVRNPTTGQWEQNVVRSAADQRLYDQWSGDRDQLRENFTPYNQYNPYTHQWATPLTYGGSQLNPPSNPNYHGGY